MQLSDFKAVIYDMDGILIDSEPLWKIAMEKVFESVGCSLKKSDLEKTVGLRIDEVIEYWYGVAPWKGASVKEVEERIIERLVELIKSDGKPLPGIIESLQFFKQEGLKIGLATSSSSLLVETVLEQLQLNAYFDETHSAETETHGKPHPAVFLTVAERLDVKPLECLVFEDSVTGVIAAKSARMTVVAIPEKTHQPSDKFVIADRIEDSMTDFLRKIRV
jgi:HAD superfamily hydrolase (TIGR01509 family)